MPGAAKARIFATQLEASGWPRYRSYSQNPESSQTCAWVGLPNPDWLASRRLYLHPPVADLVSSLASAAHSLLGRSPVPLEQKERTCFRPYQRLGCSGPEETARRHRTSAPPTRCGPRIGIFPRSPISTSRARIPAYVADSQAGKSITNTHITKVIVTKTFRERKTACSAHSIGTKTMRCRDGLSCYLTTDSRWLF